MKFNDIPKHKKEILKEKFTKYCVVVPVINGYRGYSKKYLEHPEVEPFRDIFDTYELLAYLSVKAPRLGLKTCEVPVTRTYPSDGKVPTKISSFRGNFLLIEILWHLAMGKYDAK